MCAATAASEQLRLLPSQYLVDQWTSDVGMPEETAAEMVRIPNDHLLIATAQGVVRFDGQRFRTLYPNLPKAIAHSIIWTPGFGAECMIVGYGVATVEDTKLALRYPMSSTSNSQRTIRRDRQQRLVVLTGSELYREDKPRGELKIWRRFPATAQRMVEMDNGSWLVASGTDLYLVNDESPTPTLYHKLDARIETVVRTRSGVVYVGNSQGLFRNDPGQKNFVTVQTRFSVFAIAEGAAGELWIGTEKGLQRMGTDGQLQEFGTNLQLRPEPISTILFDEDGSIWGAYLTGGFFRLRIPRFVNWSVQEGLTGGVVQAVHHDGKGGAWITARRGVHHISATGQIRDVSGDWKALNAKQSVYFEAEHKLWVIGFWGVREVDTLTLTSRKLPLPPSPAALFRIYRRASGECWVITVKGEVFKWRNGAWEAFPIEGMPVPDSTGTLVESPAGETWMAIRGAGFFRIVGQKAQALALDQPERLMVHAIYPDRSGNIWLGLDGAGIGLYENGRIRTLMVDSTAQMNSAYLIVEDTRGFLWFGLRRGLFRIPKQELLSYFRGTLKGPVPIARYSSQSGLPNANFGASTTVNHPVPADTLWLPQLRGLVRADAAGLHPNQTPPTPHIDNVLVDDVPYPIRDGEVKVPARAQRVTIGFHGTFLPVPGGVRYRYQLENFQQSPTGPYTQREATFTQLPPGQYVFRLWTANSDDVWNAHPLELRVQVAPAFYQTWTFRLAAAGLLCLAVYGAFAWRTRLLRRDNEI
ncbi:MAG: hypothetical protein JST65_18030, partial [Acidobacteria bacterium]|nr:hypothetical protein [Acidobacteriota bacterium]